MAGTTKLMTAGGGGVSLTPASSIASDVTVNVPVTGVSGGTLVCSDSSGNVGIGTSSPQTTLDVYNSSNPVVSIRKSGDASTGLQIGRDNSTLDAFIIQRENAALFFRTNNTERMRINSNGDVGINNTGLSGCRLGVSEDGNSRNAAGFNNTASGTASLAFISFQRNGVQTGTISNTGSATSYNTSSDYRLKENIQPMQGALAVVQQLNPVTYTWKADGSDGQGFIAHELQAVVPDCVTGEKDAVDEEGNPVYQGIDTSFLVATLTKAIQEQQAQIKTLTAKVAALEAK